MKFDTTDSVETLEKLIRKSKKSTRRIFKIYTRTSW